jgi:hypothetical protein
LDSGLRRNDMTMRSKLFVPASRPELFEKAMKGEADALSFDLEDSVDESMKEVARTQLRKFLRSLPANSGKDHHRARERPPPPGISRPTSKPSLVPRSTW